MDAQRLAELIREPGKLTGVDINDLKSVTEKFPFFGISHMLYLKGLSENNSENYDATLRKSAVHVADRTVLFNLLKKDAIRPEETIDQLEEDISVTEPSHEIQPSNQNEIVEEFPSYSEPQNLETVDAETEIEEKSNDEDANNISSIKLDDIFAGTHEDIDEIEIHEVIPSGSINETETVEKIATFEIEKREVHKPIFELNAIEEITDSLEVEQFESSLPKEDLIEVSLSDQDIEHKAEIPAEQNQEEKMEQPVIKNDAGISQNNTSIQQNIDIDSAPPAAPSNRMKLGSFNSWLKQKIEEKSTENSSVTPDTGTNKDEIISKFIQEEPRIGKPKAEFFNPVDMGKKSLMDDESIVTETLANVYAEQGDYEKAISTYKKLSLIFPEKNSYFAALIYELEIKQSLE